MIWWWCVYSWCLVLCVQVLNAKTAEPRPLRGHLYIYILTKDMSYMGRGYRTFYRTAFCIRKPLIWVSSDRTMAAWDWNEKGEICCSNLEKLYMHVYVICRWPLRHTIGFKMFIASAPLNWSAMQLSPICMILSWKHNGQLSPFNWTPRLLHAYFAFIKNTLPHRELLTQGVYAILKKPLVCS